MITLRDIAREAGVSITTVSNVINEKKCRVSKELVERIKEIIQRENYVPNLTARTLAKNSSRIIGVINHLVPKLNGGFLADPFHNAFISGIEDRVREKGYFVMVRTVEDAKGLQTIHRNWNLDGLILTGLFEDDFLEGVKSLNIPFALIDSYVDQPDVYNVGLEDMQGGYLATKYLLEHGHREIAFASPPVKPNGVIDKRLQGYQKALKEYDLSFNPNLVFQGEIAIPEGIKLGIKLGGRPDITAVFANADILAAGIISGLQEIGLSVPKDKSIVGFDDNYLSMITSPRLTTIHQNAEEKGVIATEMVFAQIDKDESKIQNVILPVSLVERDSVRRI